MTTNRDPNPSATRFNRWAWVGICSAAVIIAAAIVAGWILIGKKNWTDGGTLIVSDADARLRNVTWAPPVPLDGFNASDHQYEPSLSPDGDELYFVRGKAGQNPPVPGQGAHIYVSYRRNGAWTAPQPVAAVNSEFDDLGPRVSPDGKFLFFYSNRPGGFGGYDIWAAPRLASIGDAPGGWGKPVNLGPNVNSEYDEYTPGLSPDGSRLFFATNRKSAGGEQKQAWRATIRAMNNADFDLWYAVLATGNQMPKTGSPAPATEPLAEPSGDEPATTRPVATQPAESPAMAFSPAVEVPGVNTTYMEGSPCMSPAGDFLYFASDRPSGFGKFDIYRSRANSDGTFGPVENLGPTINTPDNETDPNIALNGFRLYFSTDRPLLEKGSESVPATQPGAYTLLQSDSREVFPQRAKREVPHVGWAWLVAALSILALIPLLLFMRRWDDQRLNLLQRCLLFSLLIHVLITLASSVWTVGHDVYHYVRREQGLEPPIDLMLTLNGPASPADEIGAGIREQSSSDVTAPAAAPIAAAPQPLANAEAVEAPTGVAIPGAATGAAEPLVQIESPHPAANVPMPAAAPAVPAPSQVALQDVQLHPMDPSRLSAAEAIPRTDAAAAEMARTGIAEVRIQPQVAAVDVKIQLQDSSPNSMATVPAIDRATPAAPPAPVAPVAPTAVNVDVSPARALTAARLSAVNDSTPQSTAAGFAAAKQSVSSADVVRAAPTESALPASAIANQSIIAQAAASSAAPVQARTVAIPQPAAPISADSPRLSNQELGNRLAAAEAPVVVQSVAESSHPVADRATHGADTASRPEMPTAGAAPSVSSDGGSLAAASPRSGAAPALAPEPVHVADGLAATAAPHVTVSQPGVGRLAAGEGLVAANSARLDMVRQTTGSSTAPKSLAAGVSMLPTSSAAGASLADLPHTTTDGGAASAIASAQRLVGEIAVQPTKPVTAVAELTSPTVQAGPVAAAETQPVLWGVAPGAASRWASTPTLQAIPRTNVGYSPTVRNGAGGSLATAPIANPAKIEAVATGLTAQPGQSADVTPVIALHGSAALAQAPELTPQSQSAAPADTRQVVTASTTQPAATALADGVTAAPPAGAPHAESSLVDNVPASTANSVQLAVQITSAPVGAPSGQPSIPQVKVGSAAAPARAVAELPHPQVIAAAAGDTLRATAPAASAGSGPDRHATTALAGASVKSTEVPAAGASLASSADAAPHGAAVGATGAVTAAVTVPFATADLPARVQFDRPGVKVAALPAGNTSAAPDSAVAGPIHAQPHQFAADGIAPAGHGAQTDRLALAIPASAVIPATTTDRSIRVNPFSPKIVAVAPRTTLAGPGVVVPQDSFIMPKLTAPEPLAQRAPEQRKPLVEKRGGTVESEDAVDRGLAYLARQQESDGKWSVFSDENAKPDPHRKHPHDMACTGLATLAFLTADHTPTRQGPYREVVRNALQFLLDHQASDGDLRGPKKNHGGGADEANLYDHGICTMAMSEAALMTGDRRYREAALLAAQFIVDSQNKRGGWRYRPQEAGDTSVLGWQLLALHDTEQLGFAIPEDTKDGARHFLKTVSGGKTRILGAYTPGQSPSSAMTAESLFGRLLLGDEITPDQTREVCQYLTRELPGRGQPDFYFWYYASLSLSQMPDITRAAGTNQSDGDHGDPARIADKAWRTWNVKTRDTLIEMQKKDGPAAGSWWNTVWEERGGRVFSTSLATLTLEVYYRYLPLKAGAEAEDDGARRVTAKADR